MSDAAVYRTDAVFRAHYIAEALNDAGIERYVENENSIVDELLRSLPEDTAAELDKTWNCACGQSIGAQFSACWKCGAERASLG